MNEEAFEMASNKRDKWEIEDDVRTVKRAVAIFKDKERLAEVQECIKKKKDVEHSVMLIGDGDIRQALGL